jgi:NAD dependent epimerase/dehydratase family enzyme
MRVVIAGASGFMGGYFTARLREHGHEVRHIGRSAPVRWGQTAAMTDLLEGADLLLNLAGKSVNCRYGARNRAEMRRSRLDTTRELADAVRACEHPPALWINSSTATIYRHAEDRPMTEASGELGEGFSVEVAKAWEEAFFDGDLPGTRRVALRTAIVLGDGGALPPMLRLARFGLGGPQLDGHWFGTRARRAAGVFHEFRARGGRQRFSWVHVEEVLRIILFLVEHPELDGVINVASPNPVDNRTLMRTIRRVLGIRFGLPAFRWMTELGAMAIRTETELILKSRWVVPEKLSGAGYIFEYPELETALRQILDAGSGPGTETTEE